MAEVYEVGATPVEVSQNIGVQRASCYRWSLWSGYDPPTRGESEYWGSTYIVFVMAEVCEVGATPIEVSQNIGVQLASCLLWLKCVKWVRPQ